MRKQVLRFAPNDSLVSGIGISVTSSPVLLVMPFVSLQFYNSVHPLVKTMTSQVSSENLPARWIHNPALDLTVGCGAWSLPLILLGYSSFSNSPTWAIVFYGLALFLNYPHYMSTLYRAYHNESDFRKYRIFTIHITGLVL